MATMINAALVLEGGSLRCMFTSGVLDVFVEQGIEMSYVNGVSAGSMCGLNYIARHVGRNLEINTHYLHDLPLYQYEEYAEETADLQF